MIVTGIIAEFNPFHNGHKYFLNRARNKTKADIIVGVISGNFTQRGEPAIVDKWARCKVALQQGVDIVVELPFVYAAQHAHGFASGACNLLNGIGVVDYLAFGSEQGQTPQLKALAKFLLREPRVFSQYLKINLRKGLSFPRAQASSLLKYHQTHGVPQLNHLTEDNIYHLLRHPNNILALEYLKALFRSNSPIKPVTFPRYGADFHEPHLTTTGSVASATAIRLALLQNKDTNHIKKVVPKGSWEVLQEEIQVGRSPISLNDFSPQIISLLRRIDLSHLREIAGIDEGLEYRLKRLARSSGTMETLLKGLKTKRYTQTRLQRLLVHILLGFNRKDQRLFSPVAMPPYLRILGFTQQGQEALKYIKEGSNLPLITNPARQMPDIVRCSPRGKRMWELECLATDLYVLACSSLSNRGGGQDYTRPLIKL